MSMLWQLLVLAAALGAAYYRWSRRRLYRLAREIPSGLKEYPVVGHAYMFLGSSEDHLNAIQECGRVANQQGGVSSFWLSHRLLICLTEPEAIEVVSRVCLDKDTYTLKFIRKLIGNGSIFAPVNIWQPRRRIMSPFFTKRNLSQLVPLFNEKSSIMVDLMRAEAGGGDFPVWKYITTYTFDTVGESTFGTKLNSQRNPEHGILRVIEELCHLVTRRILQPWLHPDFVFENLPIYKQYESRVQQANAFLDEIIRRKRNKVEDNGLQKKGLYHRESLLDAACEATRAHQAGQWPNAGWTNFLDTIIQSSGGEEEGYSDEEIREEMIVIIIAGNDTSAVGTSFAAVLLSRYPDVQARVYQELQEVLLGDSNRDITTEDLPKLKYLEAVIKESLRLYPPGLVSVREVVKDVRLPSGTTLVEDCSVIINIWGAHRNPAYWGADAELFRPERFLEGPLRHPAQFIPFSYSVRNCIGSTFAMISMKIALSKLVRRYRLLPPANMAAEDLTKPLRVKFEIIMRAVDNFALRVEERNGMNSNN